MAVMMTRVQSSAIREIGYDTDTDTLYIEFNKQKQYPVYEYSPVSAHTAGRMFKAKSIGSYYHRIIAPRKQYQTTARGRTIRKIMNEKSGNKLVQLAIKASRAFFRAL